MQPSDKNRVALVSLRGTGGTWLRLLMEAGTRIETGIDDCFVGHQWGSPLHPFSKAPFKTECAGPFFFGHTVATRFFHISQIGGHPFYAPTHFIVMTRDPFDTIVSAWHYWRTCGGIASIYCQVCHRPGINDSSDSLSEPWCTRIRLYISTRMG